MKYFAIGWLAIHFDIFPYNTSPNIFQRNRETERKRKFRSELYIYKSHQL